MKDNVNNKLVYSISRDGMKVWKPVLKTRATDPKVATQNSNTGQDKKSADKKDERVSS